MKVDRIQIIRNIKFGLLDIKPNKEKFEDETEGPCWEGYEQIGTKILDGREVPNCVPIKEEQSKVKEGFPIPSPSGETEEEYISKCISEIIGEYPEEGQAYAICKGEWDK
jgi:hypothetical protein